MFLSLKVRYGRFYSACVSLSLRLRSLSKLPLSLRVRPCLHGCESKRERETERPLSQSLELSIGISFTTYANVPTWKKKKGGGVFK